MQTMDPASAKVHRRDKPAARRSGGMQGEDEAAGVGLGAQGTSLDFLSMVQS